MLISSRRHTPQDLDAWNRAERAAMLMTRAQRAALASRADRALTDIAAFAARGHCYAGVSWGKDSVVLADLIARAELPIPLVYVRLRPWDNPDCDLVRDAMLARYPSARYEEVSVDCPRGIDSIEVTEMFRPVRGRFGTRHISGIRSDESAGRRLRTARWGIYTERTCAPLAHWTAHDVFRYLDIHELPVHPAYACTVGGLLDRRHIRVDALGGSEGRGHARADWERRYYGQEIDAIRRDTITPGGHDPT